MLSLGSLLYLLVALGIGLLISSTVNAQFVASLIVVVAAFIPALMLSGFLFELHNLPVAVRFLSYLFPARYFVALLQTVLLAGDVWPIILPNLAVLAGMAMLLFALTRGGFKKQLDLGMETMLAALFRIVALVRKKLLPMPQYPA